LLYGRLQTIQRLALRLFAVGLLSALPALLVVVDSASADCMPPHHESDEVRVWLMNGTTQIPGGDIAIKPYFTIARVAGVGDFDGDGKPDLVWQLFDYQAPEVDVWFMDGTNSKSPSPTRISPTADKGWRLAAVADLDGDGKPDLLWQREDFTGEARVWFMNGTVRKPNGDVAITPAPEPGWRLVGVGDFDGDGKPDLVWQREDNSAEVRVWLMDGTTRKPGGDVEVHPRSDPAWRLSAIADFDGDGKPDLVWHRTNNTGEARIWLMNGTNQKPGGDVVVTPSPDNGWEIPAVGDFNGDGKPDLLWRRCGRYQ
jgi:FG-GAP-like repeat/FG-GAP repeat